MCDRATGRETKFTPEQVEANERAQQGLEQARETVRRVLAGE